MREIDRLVEEIRHLQFDDIEKMYQKCLDVYKRQVMMSVVFLIVNLGDYHT